MRLFIRIYSFFAVLAFSVPLCIGQINTAPQQASSALNFDHLTINDGLSHNTVFCIIQDQYGYIWMGTQNGLNKYDGYSIEIYRSNDATRDDLGFIGKNISSLFEDSQGNLWVGTKKNGINFKGRYGDKFINLQNEPALASIQGYDVTAFLEDEAGKIWITTVGAGVLRYDPISKRSKVFDHVSSNLSNDLAFDIVQDKYGVIWVATAGGGLNYLIDGDQFDLSHEMLPNYPNMGGYRKKLFLDGDYLWVGTEGTGLYKMDLLTKDYIHFTTNNGIRTINSDVVRDILRSSDGKLFIATDGDGLNIYDPLTEEISSHTYVVEDKTALNSNALQCMSLDKTGNIWIGSYNGGVNVYKPNKTWFQFYSPSLKKTNDLKHRSILSILESENGNHMVGTDGGGLNWLNKNNDNRLPTFKHDPTNPNSIAGNVVKTMFKDSRNNIWIGLFGVGLDLYQPSDGSFKHVIAGAVNVWSIAEKEDGELLIGTMGSGILVLNTETLETRSFSPELKETNIMKVYVDQEGLVWVGTAENGLLIFSQSGELIAEYIHNSNNPQSLSNNEIRSIFQDSEGGIWIGTEGGGLCIWKGEGTFKQIGLENGLVANNVMAISEDHEGMIWVSTFEGISRLRRDGTVVQSFNFRTFQNTNQFNQDAIFRDDEGNLYFGGINGLTAIHPRSIKENEFASEILLTDLKIYNKSIRVGEMSEGRTILKEPIESCKTIYLSYLDKSFSIDFTLTDYRSPAENVFSYRMHGFDDQWQITPKGKRSVTYTNLDPGSYNFQVQHKEASTSVEIVIKAAFWQTAWFKVLMVLIILALLLFGMYLIIKRRDAASKRKILQLKNEKLSTEIEAKNSKLMFSSVQMAHKNEILNEVKTDLLAAQKSPEKSLRSLVRKLDIEIQNEDYWKEFNLYFNEFDQNFIKKLRASYPDLTKNDLRLCSLLRIDLSTKEIASLLNVSLRAVEQSRYRLKKRIGLPKGENLVKFIVSFDALD